MFLGAAATAAPGQAGFGALEPFQNGYLGATWNDALAAYGDGRAAMILSFESTGRTQASNSTDGKGLAEAVLPALRDHLTDNAIVVIEEAKRSVVTVSENYREAERRAKGNTQLIFLTPA